MAPAANKRHMGVEVPAGGTGKVAKTQVEPAPASAITAAPGSPPTTGSSATGGPGAGPATGGGPDPNMIPQCPGENDLVSLEEMEAYFKVMVPWVRKNTPTYLSKFNIDVKSVKLVAPAKMAENLLSTGANKVTTYKEDWRVENCTQAMSTTGMYEGSGPIWWFDPCNRIVAWGGDFVMDNKVTQQQFIVANSLWEAKRLWASSANPALRRFILPVTFPTACYTRQDAEQTIVLGPKSEKVPSFTRLPMFAGRAVILAFYENVAQCIRSLATGSLEEEGRFLKLWEAWCPDFTDKPVS